MANASGLTATLEDYLEAIWRLINDKGAARVNDIAAAVSVHKSTVTAALKRLNKEGFINYSPYETATLTARGREVGQRIAGRHDLLRRFLRDILQLKDDVAEANACRMEHVLDKDVMRRLTLFAEFIKECPRAGEDWLEHFRKYIDNNGCAIDDPECRRFTQANEKSAAQKR